MKRLAVEVSLPTFIVQLELHVLLVPRIMTNVSTLIFTLTPASNKYLTPRENATCAGQFTELFITYPAKVVSLELGQLALLGQYRAKK